MFNLFAAALVSNLAVSVPDAVKYENDFYCPPLIEPVITFDADSKYCADDETHSVVCDEAEDANNEARENINRLTDAVAYSLTSVLRNKLHKNDAADCAKNHVEHWAESGAMTKYPVGSKHGEYVRLTMLASLSEMTLAFKDAGYDIRSGAMMSWYRDLSNGVIKHFDNVCSAGAPSCKNNHRYWGGVALANVGILFDADYYFNEAYKAYEIGISEISSQGYLEKEMARGERSLMYHMYAAAALVSLHDKMQANGMAVADAEFKIKKLFNMAHGTYNKDRTSELDSDVLRSYVNYCSNPLASLQVYNKLWSYSPMQRYSNESAQNCNSEGLPYFTLMGGAVGLLH